MSDINQKCRFYPYCEIHKGLPRKVEGRKINHFSPENVKEMIYLKDQLGWSNHAIGLAFDTSGASMHEIISRGRIKIKE